MTHPDATLFCVDVSLEVEANVVFASESVAVATAVAPLIERTTLENEVRRIDAKAIVAAVAGVGLLLFATMRCERRHAMLENRCEGGQSYNFVPLQVVFTVNV